VRPGGAVPSGDELTPADATLDPPKGEFGSAPEERDLTGRDRLTWNVFSSWAAYGIFVVAGFVMPRLIDRQLGQVALGIWDFGWSLVSYFSLADLGIGASVNRYIARYRMQGDTGGIRRAAASVAAVTWCAAAVVLGLTATVVLYLPGFLGPQLAGQLGPTKWVVALLGSNVAVNLALDVSRGVVAGCHRWDIQNAINSGSQTVTVAAMIAALSLGGGLEALALVTLCATVLSESARMVAAYRVCPGLSLHPSHMSWKQARNMFVFGVKSSAAGIARLILFQGSSLVVARDLGVATLAVFARSQALVRHAETIMNKFALVLIPTASSMQASGQRAELRQLLLDSTRFGACLSVPAILGLVILGEPLLRVWMGSAYAAALVLSVLAVGSFASLTQRPTTAILNGLNAHGPVAVVALIAAFGGVALTVLMVRLGLGLPGAALALALARSFGNGVFVPTYACRLLGVPLIEYLRRVYVAPILSALPFAAILTLLRVVFSDRPVLVLACAVVAGVVVLLPLYWRYALPAMIRDAVSRGAKRVWRRLRNRSGVNPLVPPPAR
jgi:O-antigen/teichoic acid export membrane protein